METLPYDSLTLGIGRRFLARLTDSGLSTLSGLNSKTTLLDLGGLSTDRMAFRRSGVRIPSGSTTFN